MDDELLAIGGEGRIKPRALVIDGPSLITALAGDSKEDKLRKALLVFSNKCNAVVGCRVSPDQVVQ